MRLLALRRAFRYSALLVLDALSAAAALYLAFLVRFEASIPPDRRTTILEAIAVLVAIRVGLTLLFGLHRWSFRLSGFHEAVRLVTATLCGSACFAAVFYFLQRLGPPRSVILLEFFLTTAAMGALRFSPRLASGWSADRGRSRRDGVRRTIIVGAGSAGDLLLRDLQRSRDHGYLVVGFVDDDRRKVGTFLGGRPVLGTVDDLPDVIDRHDVTQVLIAIPRLSADRIQTILRLCSSLKVHFKIIPVSFTYLNDRVTASMLHDLSPEDLLPRVQNVFDVDEIRSLVSGRRILITGAGGSIGGEIARQVSGYGCESLILVDMNENSLYLLYRELRERRADVKIFAEVCDIREPSRLLRVGMAYRPHIVFHAAAHKHVPLMEEAPEEAVKNNVFGTENAARMADEAGAETFILISTDKAVRPSSVMGVTKRVAELLIRDIADSSATRFTAVRFGNVLGSAGSVVALFKQQIERGGPVTVTHPECRRYFMTISEAASLVLIAGLGRHGEICMLDMGKPMKILDLALHMITMSGHLPGVDIRIEFSGLRRGEKLTEEMMTEEEEQSRVVRDRIHAVKSPPPPFDLRECLAELRRQAEAGEQSEVLRTLKRLVPTYDSAQGGEPMPPWPAGGWPGAGSRTYRG